MTEPIFFIPIRSGSKGLREKNILMLGSKPLVYHTIDVIIDAGFLSSSIFVSSDSDMYLNLVKERYPEINVLHRQPDLSDDKSTTFDVLEDFLVPFSETQTFMLLQVTSPFRTVEDLNGALKLFEEQQPHSVVTVSPLSEPINLITTINGEGRISDLDKIDQGYHRQSYEEHVVPNGSMFISSKSKYLGYGGFFSKDTLAYKMDAAASVDIDDKYDFAKAIGVSQFFYGETTSKSAALIHELSEWNSDESRNNRVIIGDSRMVNFQDESIDSIAINGLSLLDVYEAFKSVKVNRKIDKLYLALGINDFKQGRDADETFQILLNLISMIVNDIIIFPVVPAFNRFDIDNKQVENFNARLSEIVDARVDVVVDFESVLELKDSPDGLHYTEEYQNKVYRMYHEVISS